MHKTTRIGVLFIAAAMMGAAMLCATSPRPSAQAQGIDLTVAVRQLELQATQASANATARAAAAATAAQRQVELNQLRDAQTRTALEITVAAATSQYIAGQTATPIAQTAAADAATRAAQQTAAAQTAVAATVTESARQTAVPQTMTAAPVKTAEAFAFQSTATAQALGTRRQTFEMTARIIGAALLFAVACLALAMMWRFYRSLSRPTPQPVMPSTSPSQAVVIDERGAVIEEEGRPLTPDEVARVVVESEGETVIQSSADVQGAEQLVKHLQDSGALGRGVTA